MYHKYAQRLESVRIAQEEKKIRLRFILYAEDVLSQFGKSLENGHLRTTYLLDAIHCRTKKTFMEMAYCMRFMRRYLQLQLNAVDVNIAAYKSVNSQSPFKEMAYTIKERGYPDLGKVTLGDLCENFEDVTGKSLRRLYRAALNVT